MYKLLLFPPHFGPCGLDSGAACLCFSYHLTSIKPMKSERSDWVIQTRSLFGTDNIHIINLALQLTHTDTMKSKERHASDAAFKFKEIDLAVTEENSCCPSVWLQRTQT